MLRIVPICWKQFWHLPHSNLPGPCAYDIMQSPLPETRPSTVYSTYRASPDVCREDIYREGPSIPPIVSANHSAPALATNTASSTGPTRAVRGGGHPDDAPPISILLSADQRPPVLETRPAFAVGRQFHANSPTPGRRHVRSKISARHRLSVSSPSEKPQGTSPSATSLSPLAVAQRFHTFKQLREIVHKLLQYR